jgi:hypothetical protein
MTSQPAGAPLAAPRWPPDEFYQASTVNIQEVQVQPINASGVVPELQPAEMGGS